MQKIVPFLWFSDQAEEAAKFYVSIFPDSKMGKTTHYGEAGKDVHGQPPGSVMTANFKLFGQEFVALNGGPTFKFTPAVSFVVNCETQAEVDRYWEALGAGGDPSAQQCGWLADKYGVTWQIVPTVLQKLMSDPDTVRAGWVMMAMMPMKKLDIATLQRAYDGE